MWNNKQQQNWSLLFLPHPRRQYYSWGKMSSVSLSRLNFYWVARMRDVLCSVFAVDAERLLDDEHNAAAEIKNDKSRSKTWPDTWHTHSRRSFTTSSVLMPRMSTGWKRFSCKTKITLQMTIAWSDSWPKIHIYISTLSFENIRIHYDVHVST